MKYILGFLSFVLLLPGCSVNRKPGRAGQASTLVTDGKLWSSIFQQRAAEYKALCIQAFNLARTRVDELAGLPAARPRAIITDIDETFLDNSPYAVQRALLGRDYDADSWSIWTAKGTADTLPASLAFFNYAVAKKIEVFYITNRKEKEREGTLRNLQRFGFPFADDQHLLMRQDGLSKEGRRRQVGSTHDIILLLGDNLADFSEQFDGKTEAERATNVLQYASDFGSKYIVLPNANYGGWEEALYNNSFQWTATQKDSIIKSKLKGY